MVMTLVRKNKVESSPHFNEIVKRLSEGESSRKLSAYLKNQYNEDISHAALNRYANKHIKMENRVEAELNKRAAKKKNQPKESTSKEKKVKSKTEDIVQKKADSIEEAEETMNNVASVIADNMEGVAKVAAELPEMFKRTKSQAADPEITNVTYKDAANISIQANKLYAEYFKHEETNVEVNINNGFEELADAIRKSREQIQD